MTETRVHPVTGKTLRRDVRMQTVSFGSMTRAVNMPGWYPDDDSDELPHRHPEDLEFLKSLRTAAL